MPSGYAFEFKRIYIPVKVCFAMTINKSQRHSLKITGINVREHFFSHEQFYVACSRVRKLLNIVIFSTMSFTKK